MAASCVVGALMIFGRNLVPVSEQGGLRDGDPCRLGAIQNPKTYQTTE